MSDDATCITYHTMATNKTDRGQDLVLALRISTDLRRAIDDWRRQQTDLPSRSEAVRRLLLLGLRKKPTGR